MADVDGGVISPFKFISYKVDTLHLAMYPSLELLEASEWGDSLLFGVDIRVPEYHAAKKQYLAGVSCKLTRKVALESGGETDALSIEGSAVGLFGVDGRYADKETENKIIFHQFPTLLFPYLRGAICSTLANAGFGSILLPLVNMNQVAKKTLEKATLIEMP